MIQAVSMTSRAVPFLAQAVGVCAVALLAKKIFSNMFQSRRAALPAIAVSILLFTTCMTASWAAIAAGIAAFALLGGLKGEARRPYERSPIVVGPAGPAALPVVLQQINVPDFIRDAVQTGRPELIRQLSKFLFGLEQFQAEDKKMGLAVCLQEEILGKIMQFNRGDLLEHIFSPDIAIQDKILDAILLFYADIANIVAEYAGGVFDAEGRFKVFLIIDGSLIHDLQANADARIKAYGKEYLQRMPSEEEPKQGDFLSRAMKNQPVFTQVDFGPFLAGLAP